MRPAECAAFGDLDDALERDRVAEAVEFLDHQLDTTAAILAKPAQAFFERRIGGIQEIAQHVDVAPARFGVQLYRGDDAHAASLPLPHRLRRAGERVVIGEGDRLDTTLGGQPHQRCRFEHAVRTDRVRMQVGRISRLAHASVTRRSTRVIERARPVASSTSISTALNWTGPSATWKRRGTPSRKRPTISSGESPNTESRGPTMPTSQMKAVPLGSTP